MNATLHGRALSPTARKPRSEESLTPEARSRRERDRQIEALKARLLRQQVMAAPGRENRFFVREIRGVNHPPADPGDPPTVHFR